MTRDDERPQTFGWDAAEAAAAEGDLRYGDLRWPRSTRDPLAYWDGAAWVECRPSVATMAEVSLPSPDKAALDAIVARQVNVLAFVDWVASNAAYNGSGDPGQALYDHGVNPFLRDAAVRYLGVPGVPAVSGPTPPTPHAWTIEILTNPGTSHEEWMITRDDYPCRTPEEAHAWRDVYVADGFAPEQVRVVGIAAVQP